MKNNFIPSAIFCKNFLNTNDIDIITDIQSISKVYNIDTKTNLFFEGDTAYEIFYLIEGSIKLSKISKEGREVVIKFIAPLELFAEMLLYNNNIYPVTATALIKSTLLAINIDKLKELTERRTDFTMKLLSSLTSRLKYLVDMVDSLSSTDVMQRLTKYLESLRIKKAGKIIRLPVAKGELALLLGTTPETLSRVFAKLQETKKIEIKGRDVTFID